MAWRIHLKHSTKFEYTFDVLASFNEARMSPKIKSGQNIIRHSIKVVPEPTYYKYVDYFGTNVVSFDLHSNHKELVIISDSIVETSDIEIPFTNISWDDIKTSNVLDEFFEFLQPTSLTDLITNEFEDLIESTPYEFTQEVNQLMREKISYSPGTTNVSSSATEAWQAKAGVCQDFSHIMISILRQYGIPARYISGYLYTGNGEIGEEVIGESHSWVEAWLGDWFSFDPTNGRSVGKDHIFVAYGRDYHDVSPLRGIFTGGQGKSSEVVVTLKLLQN